MSQIADFEQFNCIRLLSKARHKDWLQLAERAQQDLDRHIVAEAILFTMHNFSHHCFNIYDAISNVLIPSNIWETLESSHKITDEELFLLDVAVLFHDCSMQDPLVGEVDRGCHARTSAIKFREMCKNNGWDYKIFKPYQINMVCDIIQAHCDVKEFEMLNEYCGLNIRVKLLAGILRIADGMDVTVKRFPRENYPDLAKLEHLLKEHPDKVSDIEKMKIQDAIDHWNKLKCFERIYLKDYTAKLVVAKANYEEDPDGTAKTIKAVLSSIRKTLKGVECVCGTTVFKEFVVCQQIDTDFAEEFFKNEKEKIAWRTKIFYKKVLPFLLEKYLPAQAPDVFIKLAKDNASSYKNHVLPFIPLVKQTSLTLVKSKKPIRVINNDDEHHERRHKFIDWRQKLDVKLNDSPTYILDSIENNTLYLNKSSYLSVLGTANVNFFNLVRFFPEKYFYTQPEMVDVEPEISTEFSNEITHWKNQLCRIVQNDSFVFDSYHAGLGVSTLTVIKHNNEYMYPITKNSEKKAAGGHDRIVIPAGTYQPCDWDYGPNGHDMDPRLQVLREFGEELLGEEELRHDKNIPNMSLFDVLEEKKAAATLFGKIVDDVLCERSRVTLVPTGVAFDILRMRPEITYLLILNDSYSNELFTNYKKSYESDDIKWYKLYDDDAFNELIGNQNQPLVPPGLAALIWGREEAIRYLSTPTDNTANTACLSHVPNESKSGRLDTLNQNQTNATDCLKIDGTTVKTDVSKIGHINETHTTVLLDTFKKEVEKITYHKALDDTPPFPKELYLGLQPEHKVQESSVDKTPTSNESNSKTDKVVFVIGEWGFKSGGVSSFNYDICSAMSSVLTDGTKVVCLILGEISEPAKKDATQKNVHIVHYNKHFEQIQDSEYSHIFDSVNSSFPVDGKTIWVGHDVHTGPLAIALSKFNNNDKNAIIIHTDYATIEGYKDGNSKALEKISEQRTLIEKSNYVFAVGPRLKQRVYEVGRDDCVRIIPGLAKIPVNTNRNVCSVMTYGRFSGSISQLKQSELALAAFGRAVSQMSKDPRKTYVIKVVGLDKDDVNKAKQIVEKYAGGRALPVIPSEYTENRELLFGTLKDNCAFMMLSLTEGFGLSAWEAISAEVPLILSNRSGVHDFLWEKVGWRRGVDKYCVPIELKGSVSGELNEKDVNAAAGLLREIFEDPEGFRKGAKELKEMLKDYTWEKCAFDIANALGLDTLLFAPE